MYKVFVTTGEQEVSKDIFFKLVDVWSLSYTIVKVLTCSNELLFGISLDDVSFPFAFIGKCTDPDYLLPFQEAMFD